MKKNQARATTRSAVPEKEKMEVLERGQNRRQQTRRKGDTPDTGSKGVKAKPDNKEPLFDPEKGTPDMFHYQQGSYGRWELQ